MSKNITNKDILRQRLNERNDVKIFSNKNLNTLEFQRNAYTTKKKTNNFSEYFTLPKMNLEIQPKNYDIDLRKPMNSTKSDKPVFGGYTRDTRNSDLLNWRHNNLNLLPNKNNLQYEKFTQSNEIFSHIPIDTRQSHYDSR